MIKSVIIKLLDLVPYILLNPCGDGGGGAFMN